MFHRAGYKIILITTIAIGISFIFIDKFVTDEFANKGVSVFILIGYLFILQQFRNSKRSIHTNAKVHLSPIDGTLKSIEKIAFPDSKKTGLLLSFYVSPFQFHSIRAPFEGRVIERSTESINNSNLKIETIEIQHSQNSELITRIQVFPALFSQSGKVYAEKNSNISQGEEIGFINFDAKVTMIIGKNSKLEVKINDNVKAGVHRIATI